VFSKEKNLLKSAGDKVPSSFRDVESKLETYRLLVDELIKDAPDKAKVRDYCKFLKIPYSLNSATQLGTVFNRLQSLNRQAMNE
tara:strand:+ start:201352 stop:201603 length:252 start_codon:yes stop_codon:yes gene_type:complete